MGIDDIYSTKQDLIDQLASLALRVSDDLHLSLKEAAQRPAYTQRIENMLYIATGNTYSVTVQ